MGAPAQGVKVEVVLLAGLEELVPHVHELVGLEQLVRVGRVAELYIDLLDLPVDPWLAPFLHTS